MGRIRTTGKPARIDDYSTLKGDLPDAVRVGGVRSAVGTPIVVSGRLWGAIVVSSQLTEPLPEDTEGRLTDFTELPATAIANAESRAALERVAGEQAALRRVATLVRGVSPAEVFAAVSDEVDGLFDCGAGVARFDHDVPATVFAGVSKRIAVPIGTRFEFQDGMASVEVYRTHQSARVDGNDWSKGDGLLATTAHAVGLASSVASPIVVDGRLWGTMNLWSTEGLLPPDTGERLEKFTELVATAIANTESREAVRKLADEQAALRRVATLVARCVPAAELFSAVSDEVGKLFGSDTAAVVRFEHEPPAIVAVGIGKGVTGVPLGTRLPLDAGLAATEVYRTGRSARVDERDLASVSGALGEVHQRLHLVSVVASPITVDDRLWGTISLSATRPLPPDTGARLERFSELVGLAIASADAQEAVRLLADEQAALRRVATLAAQGVPADGDLQRSQRRGRSIVRRGPCRGRAVRSRRTDPSHSSPSRSPSKASRSAHTSSSLTKHPPGWCTQPAAPPHVDRADWSTATSEIGRIAHRSAIISSVCNPSSSRDDCGARSSALSTTKTLPPETARRLERFSELIGTAIANTESRSELAASRRRIVAASDDPRRRIERDLHDGTQQRLVALALALRATEADVPPELRNIHSELAQIATRTHGHGR